MSNEREKQGRWGRLTGGSRGAAGGDRSWRRTAQESARLYYRMDQDEAARNRRRGVVTLALEFRIPNFAGDEANERRRTHLDLAGLSDADLEAEGHRARLALCFGRFENIWQREWTEERLEACKQEFRLRRVPRSHRTGEGRSQ
ncbi:MAG: hypothetical protein GX649_08545 [Chloroflexi bacterium]|nr:hypothetical protein [Chloroflexota bacterium]